MEKDFSEEGHCVTNPVDSVVKVERRNYQCPEWPKPNCENAIVLGI